MEKFNHWQLIKLLGEGAFGEVHLWEDCITLQKVAVKRLKKNPKLKPDEISIMLKRWLKEIEWMQNLETPHIVRAAGLKDKDFLRHLTEQNDMNAEPMPVIVMEYLNGGNLRDHLNKTENSNGFVEFEVRNILCAIVGAIKYLHGECNIEHRDIKPENMMVHIEENKKIYKLTDFGYAREIPDRTVAQSVVGTRLYVAPEVIDTGKYTKSVDYWSVGIMAYELICGTTPFIPHQSFPICMRNVQLKKRENIAIVQSVDFSEDKFEFKNHIPPQNRSSSIFIEHIEPWLRLLLDTNYSTRGCDSSNILRFYSDLDSILNKKILTVFSLKTYQKYFYDIQCYRNLQDLFQQIALDTQIDSRNIFVIFPPLHPRTQLNKPMGFFVPAWCDTSNPDNPPVMLFIGEFLMGSHCNIETKIHFQKYYSSETFKKCTSLAENIPPWLMKQFENEVHFTLTHEQHLLECYLMGLKNYIIEIEHKVCYYENDLNPLNTTIAELSGRVKHFQMMLGVVSSIRNEEIPKQTLEKSNLLADQALELSWKYASIRNLYTEVVKNCRQLANNPIYKQFAERDIFDLSNYRKSMSCDYPISYRLDRAISAFEKCLQEFTKFINNHEFKSICVEIRKQVENYIKIIQITSSIRNEIGRLVNELQEQTRDVLRQTTIIDTLPTKMNSLLLDGTGTSLLNDHNYVVGETKELLSDFYKTMQDMEASMTTD